MPALLPLRRAVPALLPLRLSLADTRSLSIQTPQPRAHQANKKLDLWNLPEVLVVHLKRFSYSRTSRDKLDTAVSFPFKDLDLGPYLLQRPELAPLYDLYAVSNHYGGLGGGHYTAYCKMPGTGAWYVYDDSSVREVPESQVLSPAAYVLFYRRKGSKVGRPEGAGVGRFLWGRLAGGAARSEGGGGR